MSVPYDDGPFMTADDGPFTPGSGNTFFKNGGFSPDPEQMMKTGGVVGSPLRANIVMSKDMKRNGETYTAYAVEVYFNGKSAVLWRLFREFVTLSNQLKNRLKPYRRTLPPLPPKRFLFNKSPDFVRNRRLKLQEWIDAVLTDSVARESYEVTRFFDVFSAVQADTMGPSL